MENQICLVVEDHPFTAQGMAASILDAYSYFNVHIHATVGAAIAFLDTLPSESAGIALVDMRLTDGTGLELLAALRDRKFDKLKSIVISGTTDKQDVERAKQLGAKGFIPKSSAIELVMKVVGIVDAGGECFLPVDGNGEEVNNSKEPSVLALLAETLPRNQRRILDLLVVGRSDKEIAREVGCTDGHVGNVARDIYKHLGIGRRAQLILIAHESDYRPK